MLTVDPMQLALRPGQRVLDLGCGEGRHAVHLFASEPVEVYGVDLKFSDVQTACTRAQPFGDAPGQLLFGVADAHRLPFADNSFDVVICSEVLEHIENYRGVLAEIDRVLKPAGVFAVSVPAFFPEWVCWRLSAEYHQVEGGHIRIFRERGLRNSIEALGHCCFHRHKAHALHAPYWWLKCLLWGKPQAKLLQLYHRFLVWDLMQKPLLTRTLDKLLNPLLGKSLVLYFVKTTVKPPASTQGTPSAPRTDAALESAA